MAEINLGDLRVDEDDLSEGWYVIQKNNNLVWITHEDNIKVEIEYVDGEYYFSSNYDYIDRCVRDIDSFERSMGDVSLDLVISVLDCIKGYHEEFGRAD